jgi:hypothetical protein
MFKRASGCCLTAVLVIVLVGCTGRAGSGASSPNTGSTQTTTESTTTTSTSTTTTTPTVDRAVVRWKKRWGMKIQAPIRHAASILDANAILALSGDAAANYRLTAAFNTLSNCRNPLELPPLSPTPSVLRKARKLTLAACREIYVGVDGVIEGLNTGSSSAAQAGLARVHDGERTLKHAARLVRSAPTTTA